MSRKIVHLIAVVTIITLVSGCQPVRRFPDFPRSLPTNAVPITEGWMLSGKNPDMYQFYMDGEIMHNGKFSGTLKSVPNSDGNTAASTRQSIRPDEYRGKRIRYSGWMKTQDVSNMSSLWLRVDAVDGSVAAFDNLVEQNGFVMGDSDWKRYEIVLDVPENAREILFGIFVSGIGQTWLDDFQLEVVGTDVPVTKLSGVESINKELAEYWKTQGEAAWQKNEDQAQARIASDPMQPVNMDFEGK
jgi:hypothetical protein